MKIAVIVAELRARHSSSTPTGYSLLTLLGARSESRWAD